MQSSNVSRGSAAGAGPHGKMPLPRLEPQREIAIPLKKPRVARACNSCRMRKTKCSGEQPQCKECRELDLSCVYELSRKDRLHETTEQKHFLISLLRDVSLRTNEEDKKKIHDALKIVDPDTATPTSSASFEAFHERYREAGPAEVEKAEALSSSNVAADQSLDPTEEISRARWLLNVRSELEYVDEPDRLSSGDPDAPDETNTRRTHALEDQEELLQREMHARNFSFYLDSDSVEIDATVDPYEMPSLETANRLFECYVEAVQCWLPIIPTAFESQLRNCYERPYPIPGKWKAILNLVFAIGARYTDLTKNEGQPSGREHVVYMSKAVRILGVNETAIMTSTPDLSLIQAFALLSFYYLISGHAHSRAWITIGISLRYALGFGLQLRSANPLTPLAKKETLVRTWWSLRYLECLLSTITGHPCVIPNDNCNVPLPRILPEEQSKQSTVLFLEAESKIGFIVQTALAKLYSVRAAITHWRDVHKAIVSLTSELDKWAQTTIPDDTGPTLNLHSQRERLLLRFSYFSTRILVTRPCLCPPKRRIEAREESVGFDQKMAEVCVQAAQDLTQLLPEQPDIQWIREGPWWCLVHYMMQALAIFLLEMSCGLVHVANNRADITRSIKKLVRWLRFMQQRDAAVERALKVVLNVLRKARNEVEIADILQEELANTYGGHLVQPWMWQADSLDPGASYPQLLSSFGGESPMDEFSEFQTGLSSMPDPLPMPHIYGNAFAENLLGSNGGEMSDG